MVHEYNAKLVLNLPGVICILPGIDHYPSLNPLNMYMNQWLNDFSRLLYPNICASCGRDLYHNKNMICWLCMKELPRTGFECHHDNPAAKIFYGRLPLQQVFSWLFFNKGSVTQHLVHQIKYRKNLSLGRYLGELMAESMISSGLYNGIDVLVPLPLNKKKLVKRGFNQAMVICEGMAPVLNIPVEPVAVYRKKYTETQTKKTRIQRLENVEEVFDIKDAHLLENRHALLVDDVITTGATMEACGKALLGISGLNLSLASLAIASKY